MKSFPKKYIGWLAVLSLSFLLISCIGSNLFVEGKQAYNRMEYASAVSLFQQAADEENAEALWYLSRMYAEGEGVGKDEAKALQLLQRSADGGCDKAQFDMGIRHLIGKDVDRDNQKAMQYFRSSADQGNASSMAFMGIMYATGTGVEKNLTTAVSHFQQARENGYGVPEEFLTEEGISNYKPQVN